MEPMWLIRYVWAAPATGVGLLVMILGIRRASVRVVGGVIEAHGPTIAWALSHLTLLPGGVAAMTLGHVVVARDRQTLEATHAHEREHVRQYEAWGPLFIPAYLAASAWAALRGGHFYHDNRFEAGAVMAERTARSFPRA